MARLSRLSDMLITDDILRSYLYAAVLAMVRDHAETDVITYEIRPDEEYRADLLAHRAYGTAELRWVVKLVVGVDDEADPLPVGTSIRLPSSAWVREKIRHFLDDGGI
ncbi:baseplate protein [Aeromonas veronii]|uniref:Baseplate protein n=1 Tax=Aeromonas veronii TaxID=654 RepID=A0AAX2UP16_AERVE|nr:MULTISPECIES: baseplate protein [Aeromonas]TND51975.1 baseplate protein [Aeromonas veronii]